MTEDSTTLTQAAANGHEERGDGVRTYRGRKLEEILPKIREELGADAIILREREGLVGGFGGFFAQRFIEVQARRGGPSIDVYDEDGEHELEAPGGQSAGEAPDEFMAALRHAASAWSEEQDANGVTVPDGSEPGIGDDAVPALTTRAGSDAAADARALAAAHEPAALASGAVQPANFRRLQAAPAETPVEPTVEAPAAPPAELTVEAPAEPPAEPTVEAPAEPPVKPVVAPPKATQPTRKRTAPAKRAQKAGGAPRTSRKSTGAAGAARAAKRVEAPPVPAHPPAAAPVSAPPVAASAPPTPAPAPPAPTPPAPAPPTSRAPGSSAPAPPAPTPPAPAPPVSAIPQVPTSRASSNPTPDAARRPDRTPASYRTQPPTRPVLSIGSAADAALPPSTALSWSPQPQPQPPQPAPASARPLRRSPSASAGHGRRGPRLRDVIARRLNRSGAPAAAAALAAHPLDTAAAAAITRDLTACGVSADMAATLIAEAAAHGSPLAPDHTLRAGARAQLVRRIVHAPPLPATGAAVAFVGAGGAGKTSCAASLASAYARSSTLTVSALSLRAPDGGRALSELLRGMHVEVSAVAPQQAAHAVAERRSGGLVILDTVAVSPGDGNAMQALGAELAPLSLDAVYIALPATLGPQAARGVLASFAPLHPTAVAITHADETDQIGVVVEIAAVNRIPLVYLHAGPDPRTALSAVDANAVAARLLP